MSTSSSLSKRIAGFARAISRFTCRTRQYSSGLALGGRDRKLLQGVERGRLPGETNAAMRGGLDPRGQPPRKADLFGDPLRRGVPVGLEQPITLHRLPGFLGRESVHRRRLRPDEGGHPLRLHRPVLDPRGSLQQERDPLRREPADWPWASSAASRAATASASCHFRRSAGVCFFHWASVSGLYSRSRSTSNSACRTCQSGWPAASKSCGLISVVSSIRRYSSGKSRLSRGATAAGQVGVERETPLDDPPAAVDQRRGKRRPAAVDRADPLRQLP